MTEIVWFCFPCLCAFEANVNRQPNTANLEEREVLHLCCELYFFTLHSYRPMYPSLQICS